MAVSPRLQAQEPESGPGFVLQGEGGLVTALLLDPATPSTLYAATARGLYRSIDSGANWEASNRGLEGHSVLALAVDPASHMLYATTDTGGVYRSPDGGGVWAAANVGLTSRYIGVVAVQGGAVYAGTEAGRIFRSTDSAATWTELTPLTRESPSRPSPSILRIPKSSSPARTARGSSGARTAERPGYTPPDS